MYLSMRKCNPVNPYVPVRTPTCVRAILYTPKCLAPLFDCRWPFSETRSIDSYLGGPSRWPARGRDKDLVEFDQDVRCSATDLNKADFQGPVLVPLLSHAILDRICRVAGACRSILNHARQAEQLPGVLEGSLAKSKQVQTSWKTRRQREETAHRTYVIAHNNYKSNSNSNNQ